MFPSTKETEFNFCIERFGAWCTFLVYFPLKGQFIQKFSYLSFFVKFVEEILSFS